MKIMGIEHVAALVSLQTENPVLLLKLDMAYEQMDSRMARDLADMRNIITNDAFDALISNQMVLIHPEAVSVSDHETYGWMVSVLKQIIANCSAPVIMLNFVHGEIADICSTMNYSVPSGVKMQPGARSRAA